MTLTPNPNGLLIASTLFALSGIALFAKTVLYSKATPHTNAERYAQHIDNRVASWFALPMLGVGAFLHGVGQLTASPLGAGLICLILALALTLILYAALEGSIADALMANTARESESEPPRQLLAAPPKLKAVDFREVDGENTEGELHALPAE
jgi:hypothetical protein